MPVKLFMGHGDRHNDLEDKINKWLADSGAIIKQISAAASQEMGQKPFVAIWYEDPPKSN
jgi:hypothetical protein